MSTCCASASPLPAPSQSNQMHARAPCIYNERQEDRKHKRMPHGVKGNIFLFQVKAIKCIACSCTQPHLQREVRRKHKRQPLPVPSNVDNSNQMNAFTKHTGNEKRQEEATAVQVWQSNASCCTKIQCHRKAQEKCSQNTTQPPKPQTKHNQTKPERLQLSNTAQAKCDSCPQASGSRFHMQLLHYAQVTSF